MLDEADEISPEQYEKKLQINELRAVLYDIILDKLDIELPYALRIRTENSENLWPWCWQTFGPCYGFSENEPYPTLQAMVIVSKYFFDEFVDECNGYEGKWIVHWLDEPDKYQLSFRNKVDRDFFMEANRALDLCRIIGMRFVP